MLRVIKRPHSLSRRRLCHGVAYILLFLLGGPSLHAQELSGPGMIWRVRGNAGTVFLAGSIHQLPADRKALPPTYNQAYGESEQLAMEIDLDAISPAELAIELVSRATYPEGRSLKTELGPVRWQALQGRLGRFGLPPMLADRLEPWAVALLLASGRLLDSGFTPDSGVEMQLMARAKADGKPIEGLETASFQMDLFDQLPQHQQLDLLDETLEHNEDLPDQLQALEGAWRSGEVQRLEPLVFRSGRPAPQVSINLLDRRNAEWVPRILSFLQRPDDTLVVVGALHLLGRNGLVALLEQQGLRVEQIHSVAP